MATLIVQVVSMVGFFISLILFFLYGKSGSQDKYKLVQYTLLSVTCMSIFITITFFT
ncbi:MULTISPECIES: hypothetical protein [Bacillaceae]|uniref:NADH dehydrogenase subunit 5 n=1 Tax=Evansella alkalicola TaxID=745819 RepID=A0ABS6K046_9BACI|nr:MULTISPECIES: hypothetical protein [Bacillaceae]MBU9724226.1 hypothetical protein [Bacillus alkalicola]